MELLQKLLTTPVDFFLDYGGPFVLVLSVLVFVHEFGHYIVARWCGVKVEQFSIGFGRELFGWTDKKGTRWKFSLIPLGGYVQMFGDVDPASARHSEGVAEDGTQKTRPFTAEEKKVAFFNQPVGRRAAIVFAGPAINYLFAIVILAGLYAWQGQPFTPPVAAGVVEGSPAEAAGIQPDDMIVAINGAEIRRFEDLRKTVAVNLGSELRVQVRRSIGDGKWSDELTALSVTPNVVEETDRFGFKHSMGRIGVSSPAGAFEMQEHNILTAVVAATVETASITADTLKALGQMILGVRSAEELGGILRIGAYAGDFAQQGMIAFITFAALLSVNLGFINLLPIPVLDGGHLAMYAMEKLRGRPLSEKVQEFALKVGLAFLFGIMAFATLNDLAQLRIFDYVKGLIS